MAKSRERLLAREMRKNGESIREIAKKVGVTRSSVSLWCRDIILTEDQIKILVDKDVQGGIKGRMKSWKLHREERLERVVKYGNEGVKRIGDLSNRELFLIGLALYWAEGSKTGRRVVFVNSDPNMICLFIRWVKECFAISSENLSCRVQINETHSFRVNDIEEYWSKVTGIPLCQFTKTTRIHSLTKKIYEDSTSYYGVLALKVRKSTNMSYLVDGGISHLRGLGRLMVQ